MPKQLPVILDEWGTPISSSAASAAISTAKLNNDYAINDYSSNKNSFNNISDSLTGIFGMPYQFSSIVDPSIENSNIGRKFSEKIFSVAPVLFLSPGEPKFMDGSTKNERIAMAQKLSGVLDSDDDEDDGKEFDDGRYYTFSSEFTEYKKYANVALRTLALYMGIQNVEIPIPGKNKYVALKNIDIEDFLNSSFVKLFGTQTTIPFFLDAESAIQESFSNSTTESMVSQTANGFSQTSREIQFLLGSKDEGKLGAALQDMVTSATETIGSVVSNISDALTGKNMITRLSNELTTVVSGGKIVFPEIWSDSEYDRDYNINIKLRSPDPDPISIYLNIYMPIILLISMAAPRQIGNTSTSYESPFLVRATYKSIFSCDLGMITSLTITKGGEGQWNVMGHPITADVSISLKDLYGSLFISKRMGLLCNTAQMDYLAIMAGIDMNEYEPTRMMKLAAQILGDTVRDWADDMWGGIKKKLNQAASGVLSRFTDTRFLGY